MEESQQKGYRMEKGTDYPDTPNAPEAPKPPRYPDPRTQEAHPRVEEFPSTPPAPSAPPIPPAAGVVGSKIVFWIVGGFIVLGVGFGIFVYTKLKSLPFRFDDDKIIVEDSKGDKIEIDRKPTLPDDFPIDIPIFPTGGTELTASARLVGRNGETALGSVFTWETKSVLGVVKNYYIAALQENGWRVTLTTNPDNVAENFIVADKVKENRGVTFLLREKDDTNKIQIILTFTGVRGEAI